MPDPCRASVYIATSLDGFIARSDGGLDWLPQPSEGGPDYGFHAFMASVDVLIMGRGTFETVLGFGGPWPYEGTPVVVLSRTLEEASLPEALAGKVQIRRGEPVEVLAQLADEGHRHAYVDGGETIRAFLRAGQIHRLILTRVPVLLGEGIPLFGPLGRDVRLRLEGVEAFSTGLTQATYVV